MENIHHLIIANLLPSSIGSNSFILLLESKINQNYRFPIVIGYQEAQAITIEIEGIKPSRPLTHDLLVNILDQISININCVTITKFIDGIFYSTISLISNSILFEIDSRPSDAVAIAIRSKVPIKISNSLIKSLSVSLQNDISDKLETNDTLDKYKSLNSEELNRLLNEALLNENYELAAKIRDDISRIKNTNEIK